MKKYGKRSIFIDRLHKGLVLTCVGLTIYGTSHFAMRWYRYFTVLRPIQQQRELEDSKKLLSEGSPTNVQA